MPKFKIRHITHYKYDDPVRDSANQIMLYPVKGDYQEVLKHDILVSGQPTIDTHTDYYGNEIGTFTQAQPHHELIIDSRLTVVTTPRRMPEDNTPSEVQWNELERIGGQLQFLDFLKQEKFEALPEVQNLIAQEHKLHSTPLQSAQHFSAYIYQNFAYKKGITTVESTLDEIWKIKTGVCQDFAHILLAILRLMNIPSRYVSGYICPKKNGMRGEGATHAWVEAYIPFYGWLGLDPTNNCLVDQTHVKLAVGKNFSDCSPVRGTYRGTSNHSLDVSVQVSYEDGQTMEGDHAIIAEVPAAAATQRNSFRRHQEMQMQQ